MTSAENRRLFVVGPELPWPATHGGRVDIWNRYAGLREQGWSIAMACWVDEADGPVQHEAIGAVFSLFLPLQRAHGGAAVASRLGRMMRMPSLAARYHVDEAGYARLRDEARRFAPAAVIGEFVYTFELARRLARELGVPLIIRSHNIEHRYMATQQRLARPLSRQFRQTTLARLHLGRYEFAALSAADAVLDISRSDADYWRGRGVGRVHWAPSVFPRLESAAGAVMPWAERPYDVGYLGNLWAPNNVAALSWLARDILPGVFEARPDITVLIAGANPAPALVEQLAAIPQVTLLANPADAAHTRSLARVLVNPILEGSGLNTKSVEMLYADSPLVVTPFAIAGMPDDIASALSVAPDAAGFARAILAELEQPFVAGTARMEARATFGRAGAQRLSDLLAGIIAAGVVSR